MSVKTGLSAQLGDLKECDKEQIHLSGAIQGHGALLMFSWPDQRVQAFSENAAELLELSKDPLGSKLNHFLEPDFVQMIETAVKAYPWRTKGRHLQFQSNFGNLDAYLFESEGLFGLELEIIPSAGVQETNIQMEIEQNLKEFMFELKEGESLEKLAHLACERVRKITGIDRVMMYKFVAPSWHGEVIAEDRVIHSHSFMGHRFPSSDIPKPARQLYLRNQVRLIVDVDEPIYAITPNKNLHTQKALDLSDSRLRSVSPIHLEYLRNMGVRASLSFAVTVNGNLWGLIACHHMQPFRLSQAKRAACEMIANAFAAQGPMLETLIDLRRRTGFEKKLKSFLEEIMVSADSLDALFRNHKSLSEVFLTTGAAFVSPQKVDAAGMTPGKNELLKLSSLILAEMEKTHQDFYLSSNFEGLAGELGISPDMVSGVLAVQIPSLPGALFMVFRPQIVKTVTWGGDPAKNLEKKNFQGQINPRLSFEAWKEDIHHHSQDWESYELEGMLFLRDFIFDSLMHKQQLIRELTEDLKVLRSKNAN